MRDKHLTETLCTSKVQLHLDSHQSQPFQNKSLSQTGWLTGWLTGCTRSSLSKVQQIGAENGKSYPRQPFEQQSTSISSIKPKVNRVILFCFRRIYNSSALDFSSLRFFSCNNLPKPGPFISTRLTNERFSGPDLKMGSVHGR